MLSWVFSCKLYGSNKICKEKIYFLGFYIEKTEKSLQRFKNGQRFVYENILSFVKQQWSVLNILAVEIVMNLIYYTSSDRSGSK